MILLFILLSYIQVYAQGNNTEPRPFKPSSLYHVRIELATPIVLDNDEEVARRLALIANDALTAANALHLRQQANFTNAFSDRDITDGIRVEIVRRLPLKNQTIIYFIVYHRDEPIRGDIMAIDMNLLSMQHMSAILQYPLNRVIAQKDLNQVQSSAWWIIALVVGSGILILCFGWCLLFIYYNSCGAQQIPYDTPKTIYQKDDANQCDSPNTNKSRDQQAPNCEKSNVFSTKNETRTKQRSSEYDWNPRTQTISSSLPALRSEDATGIRAGKMTGKQSTSPKDSQKSSKKEVDEFLASPNDTAGAEGRRANEMHYLDPLENILSKAEKSETNEEAKRIPLKSSVMRRANRTVRPKSALKSRPFRTCEGNIMNEMDGMVWSHYDAGDAVSSIYSISACSTEHPRPAHPIENGVLQLKQQSTDGGKPLSML